MQTDKRAIRLAVNNTLEKYSVLCSPEIGDAVADAVIEALLAKSQRRQQKRNDVFPIAKALAGVCGIELKPNSGMLFKEAKLLLSAQPSPTPELIQDHYGKDSAYVCNWYKVDWRGKKGQSPMPANVRMTWSEIAGKRFETQKPLVVK